MAAARRTFVTSAIFSVGVRHTWGPHRDIARVRAPVLASSTHPARDRAFLPALLAAAFAGCDPETGSDLEVDAALPSVEACDPARGWNRDWADLEAEVALRIDRARARGADCDEAGKLPVAPALSRNGALTCAARVHALSMASRGFTGHVDPDGVDPQMRVSAAGYEGTIVEHWAAGPDDAQALVDDLWLRSASHCADLVTRDFVDVGVAHVGDVEAEHDHYWVVVLGAP